MFKSKVRGLTNFISDIRNCKSREDEERKINEELAKMRGQMNGKKITDGYLKRKCACKLIFIFLMGHNVDIGHMDAVNLLHSGKYAEKFAGYLFLSVIVNTKSKLMALVLGAIKYDIHSNNPIHQNMALQYLANMANEDMTNEFGETVTRLLLSHETTDNVKQSAALCLLRFFRLNPDVIPESKEGTIDRITELLADVDLGVVTAAASLVEALAEAGRVNGRNCVTLAVSKLHCIVRSSCLDLKDYSYHRACAPWQCVKLLRILRHFPDDMEPRARSYLLQATDLIFKRSNEHVSSKRKEHLYAKCAVLFEAIILLHHLALDAELATSTCYLLTGLLRQRDPNLKFVAMDTLQMLTDNEKCKSNVKPFLKVIKECMNSTTDVCIRQKASDIMYALCDESNFEDTVQDMLYYIETSDVDVRAETVSKISILSEEYCTNKNVYVDVILKLVSFASSYVENEILYKLVQVARENEGLKTHAAQSVFDVLVMFPGNEKLTFLAGYILGEFGNLIAGDSRYSPTKQYNLIDSNFKLCSLPTKASLMTTYMKFINLYPQLKLQLQNVFFNNAYNSDLEIQQRAVEYFHLTQTASPDTLALIFEEIPPLNETLFLENKISKMKLGSASSVHTLSKFGRLKCLKLIHSQSQINVNNASKKYFSAHVSYSMTNICYGSLKPNSLEKKLLSPLKPNVAYQLQPQKSVLSQPNLTLSKYKSCHPNSLLNLDDLNESNANEVQVTDLFILDKTVLIYDSHKLCVTAHGDFEEYRGEIQLTFHNKTSQPFLNINCHFNLQGLESCLKIHTEPLNPSIQANQKIVQIVEVESLAAFSTMPTMTLFFEWNFEQQTSTIRLPLALHKFIEPHMLSSRDFSTKWHVLNRPQQEFHAMFPVQYFVGDDTLHRKLKDLGMSIVEIIGDEMSFACAGVFHSRACQVGILLRFQTDGLHCMLNMRAFDYNVLKEFSRIAQLCF